MKGSESMEDAQIVDLYFARSEQAIAETTHKYGKYLYTIAFNILSSNRDSEEAVNDTYLGAWHSIPPHRPNRLSTYLGKITRRIALEKWKYYRTQKRGGGEVSFALDELEECITTGETPQQVLEMKELTRRINSFLKSLPEIEQRIFVCRYWYVMPLKEIAREFGFSESKVKSILSRTRAKLRTCLEKEGITV